MGAISEELKNQQQINEEIFRRLELLDENRVRQESQLNKVREYCFKQKSEVNNQRPELFQQKLENISLLNQ